MADDPVSGAQAEVPVRDLAPCDKMPPQMRKLWDERIFNLVKQRASLLDGDAVLTWAFILWMIFASMVGLLGLIDPLRFPIFVEVCYSLAAFFVYYSIIGFMRRQSERNLILLSAQHPDPNYWKSEEFKKRKPYSEEDDPPVARFAFRLRSALGLPRRGLAQRSVVLFQFIAGAGYLYNYAYFVLWKGVITPDHFAPLFWAIHVTVTGGGILILFKNYGFLVDTSRLLKAIEGLAGNILWRGNPPQKPELPQKPCEEDKEKK